MKTKLPVIARVLLGLIFFVFGIIGLFNLVPPPPNLPERMQTFMAGMAATGYFFQLVKGTEIICGFLLLSGTFVPLALVALAPVALNIFLVHSFMDPQGLAIPIVIGILMIYLSFFSPYSAPIKALFRKK
jgi:putative oxidoreductase